MGPPGSQQTRTGPDVTSRKTAFVPRHARRKILRDPGHAEGSIATVPSASSVLAVAGCIRSASSPSCYVSSVRRADFLCLAVVIAVVVVVAGYSSFSRFLFFLSSSPSSCFLFFSSFFYFFLTFSLLLVLLLYLACSALLSSRLYPVCLSSLVFRAFYHPSNCFPVLCRCRCRPISSSSSCNRYSYCYCCFVVVVSCLLYPCCSPCILAFGTIAVFLALCCCRRRPVSSSLPHNCYSY